MKKDTILFDMDGVLINSEPLHFREWQMTLAPYGITMEFEPYKRCIGMSAAGLRDLFREMYGIDLSGEGGKFVEEFHRNMEILEEAEGVPLTPGALETVKALRERGCRMAVASSSPMKAIVRCMNGAGFSPYMDLLFSGEAVAHSKPAPDTFLAAAEALGVRPDQCVVVEDSHNGVLAAKAAGMYCVGFVNPDSGNQDLSEADVLTGDFRELLSILGL